MKSCGAFLPVTGTVVNVPSVGWGAENSYLLKEAKACDTDDELKA